MSDRVLKCFNCGGEGHYAKDCQNGKLSSMQNGLKIGPTPTEEIEALGIIGIMIGGRETGIEQEVIPVSIADYQGISQGNALNRERKDPEKIDGERSIGVEREGRVQFAIIAKRVDILLGTATWVNSCEFRKGSLML
jgi:hypothetical protein